jgi:hypothetical protein
VSSANHLARLGQLIEAADRWECVHFAARSELSVFEAFRKSKFHVATVPGSVLASDAELFDALASAFAFPDYFGHNWDALVDCLGDLEWLEAEGYVLVIDDADASGLSEPLARLLQIWPSVAQGWSAEGKPFHLVGLLQRYGDAPAT